MEKKSNPSFGQRDRFFSLIPVYEKSGLTQKAFCKEHHLSFFTFQYWLRKYRDKEVTPSSFVELKVSSGKFRASGLEIIFPSGAKIICHDQSDISLIRSLIL